MEQWELHGFYSLAKRLTDEQALAHRRYMTANLPSLSHQAGKAYARLTREITAQTGLASQPHVTSPRSRVGRKPVYNIRVRAIVRPTVDHEKLTSALLEHAGNEEQMKQSAIGRDADVA